MLLTINEILISYFLPTAFEAEGVNTSAFTRLPATDETVEEKLACVVAFTLVLPDEFTIINFSISNFNSDASSTVAVRTTLSPVVANATDLRTSLESNT